MTYTKKQAKADVVAVINHVYGDMDALALQLSEVQDAYLALNTEYAQLQADFDAYKLRNPEELVLLDADFTQQAAGAMTGARWVGLFGKSPWGSTVGDAYLAERGMAVVTSPIDGRNALKLEMPANDMRTTVITSLIGRPDIIVEEVRFEQEIAFSPGFDMGLGFKLNGIGVAPDGKNAPTGGADPAGYMSLRFMGRGPGGGGAGTRPKGSVCLYSYDNYPSANGVWGADHFLEAPFVAGQVQRCWMEVRLNTPGVEDGRMAGGINNVSGSGMVGHFEDDSYAYFGIEDAQLGPTKGVNQFQFSVFRGGQKAEWEVPTAGQIYFYRLRVVATKWRAR